MPGLRQEPLALSRVKTGEAARPTLHPTDLTGFQKRHSPPNTLDSVPPHTDEQGAKNLSGLQDHNISNNAAA